MNTSKTLHNLIFIVVNFYLIYEGRISILLLTELVLLAQLVVAILAALWPFSVRFSAWGRLMSTYSESVDKIDVARGRCVPVPPFDDDASPAWQSASR